MVWLQNVSKPKYLIMEKMLLHGLGLTGKRKYSCMVVFSLFGLEMSTFSLTGNEFD